MRLGRRSPPPSPATTDPDAPRSSPPALRELDALERAIEHLGERARTEVLCRVQGDGAEFPLWSVSIGGEQRPCPTLLLVGGIHGLERIGTEVVIAFLETVAERLRWDRLWQDALERARIVAVPLVNPAGMWMRTRANPQGVDLMRNAPHSAGGRATFLLGGQRLSRRLPWYAGDPRAGMEPESAALCRFVQRVLHESSATISLDCHSGFGFVDRLWFPYARTRKPIPHLAEVVGIKRLLDRTLPNHVYRVEPQAQAYTVVGDLWDYLYDAHLQTSRPAPFVPLTLEMGSWTWIRKNPRQIWSAQGSFNPVLPHRRQRTLRRHLPLFDLAFHSVVSHRSWTPSSTSAREELEREAFATWEI